MPDLATLHRRPATPAREAVRNMSQADRPLPGFELEHALEATNAQGEADPERIMAVSQLGRERRTLANFRHQKYTAALANVMVLPWDKVGRNRPCLCGSGKRYKVCCLNRTDRTVRVVIDPEVLDVEPGAPVRYWAPGTFRFGSYGVPAVVARSCCDGTVDLAFITPDDVRILQRVEVAGLADPSSACWGFGERPHNDLSPTSA